MLRTPWVVLTCGSLALCLSFGLRSSFGLFLQPVSLDNGWGREVFSFALAIQNLLWGVFGPVMAAIGDRFGMGRVMVGCALAYVLGLVITAYTQNPISLHLGSGFFVGLGLSGITFATILAAIARWYPPEKRSVAMGIATAAGSFGQFTLVPVAQYFITGWNWHIALLWLAAIAFLMVPLAAPFSWRSSREPEPEAAQPMRKALKEALGERGFHLIFWGYFVCGFQISMLSMHLPAFVVDSGLKAEHGMMAIALIGLFNVIGSFTAGLLGARYSKKYLLACIYAIRAALIATLILLPLTPPLLYAFAMAMGFLWLSTVPLTNGLVGQIFGMNYAGMLAAIVFFGHQVGSFGGVWLAGLVFDTTASYTPALVISIILSVLAALANLPVNEKPLALRKAGIAPTAA